MTKDYYVIETTTVRYEVEANSEEQAIDDMEYERDTINYSKVIHREVWVEEE
jgi:hypothetical protein